MNEQPFNHPSTTEAIEPAIRERLMRLNTSAIANALLSRGFKNAYLVGLAPLSSGQAPLVGPAYTLRFIPAREDLDTFANYRRDDNPHRLAIETCPEGAVLVIDSGDSITVSTMGDMMALRLKVRGAAGVVTDGGYRDSPAIIKIGLPCYQRQNAPPATSIGLHPVALNEPIGCAGVAIYPGDIIVGDAEGVIAIPRHLVDEVSKEAEATMAYEEFAEQWIEQGRAIFGLFPACDESRAEYEQWVEQGRPKLGELFS